MIKLGIIGSGFGLYGLVPAFKDLKGCSIECVCASNDERIAKYCFSSGITNIYTRWQQMLEKEKLDAVAIAVVPSAQYTIAKAALKKRLHVFAEKPLADSYKHAKTLYDLALRQKVTHSIDFNFPEIDQWIQVKQLLDCGMYGKLTHIAVKWDFLSYDIKNGIASWKTDASKGGGALSFYSCHTLYYLEYFAGEITDIQSTLSYAQDSLNGGEVGADLLITFKNNINGYAHISCNSKDLFKHQLTFQCENATIILENENSFFGNFTITVYTGDKVNKIEFKHINTTEDERIKAVRKIAKRFIESCYNKKQMQPSFKDGVRVQELIEIIKKQHV